MTSPHMKQSSMDNKTIYPTSILTTNTQSQLPSTSYGISTIIPLDNTHLEENLSLPNDADGSKLTPLYSTSNLPAFVAQALAGKDTSSILPPADSKSTQSNVHLTAKEDDLDPNQSGNALVVASNQDIGNVETMPIPVINQSKGAVATAYHPNEHTYVDITEYLNLPQTEAAKKLGIPTSTLSKRWKEAAANRKWPYRTVSRLDKGKSSVIQIPSNYE